MGRSEFEDFLAELPKEGEMSEEVLNGSIDEIDQVFLDMVPKEAREEREQFLTPPKIADFMLGWCFQDGGESLIDPAVGTGVFLSRAVEHRKGLDLSGYDVDSLMLECTKNRMEKKGGYENLDLKQQDFLSENYPEKRDYLICNPPYKKFKEYENTGRIDWLKHRYGIDISSQANLFVAFIAHSYSFLNDGGRAAFITPNEFLYSNYGEGVKKFLLENFRIDGMVLLDSEDVFEDVLTTPVITLLEKGEPEGDVKFMKTDDPHGLCELLPLEDTESNDVQLNVLPQEELNSEDKWQKYFTDFEVVKSDILCRFDSIADIKRGIATGHNDYFLFTSTEIAEEQILEQHFSRVIAKSTDCKNLVITTDDIESLDDQGRPTYLLYNVENKTNSLSDYIEFGESIDADERYLCSHRTPWYEVERREPAPILATTFSRSDMRFVYNEAGVRNLTAFHSIYPGFDEENQIKALLAFLNSRAFSEIMDVEKRIHGGMGKFEPNDLKSLDVLNVRELNEDMINRLANGFDELDQRRRSGESTDPILDEIDQMIEDLV